MKRFHEILPGALLLSYAVYTAFVPANLAHSIILFSLAGLFGYSSYLYCQKQPSMQKELSEFKEKMEKELSQQKESYEVRLKQVEDVAAAMALSSAKAA